MSSAVVQSQTTNQLSIGGSTVLHLHNFNHMQIGLGRGLVDGQNSIDDIGGKLNSECRVQLCGQGCSCNADKKFSVDLFGDLEVIEEL
jgi:hypothetical protein